MAAGPCWPQAPLPVFGEVASGRAAIGVPLNDPFRNQDSVRAHLYLQAAF
jgi:hypothetical protein